MSVRVLVGGVGYRFQSDLSFGLHVSDALAAEPPEGVEVMDLGYGAIFATQDLMVADPPYDRVVLVAAAVRGRAPGLYEGTGTPPHESDEEIQERVREAGAGVLDLDHLLVIGRRFGAFPDEVRVLELEPVETGPGERLSGVAARLLPEAVERVRAAAVEPRLART